MSEINAKLQVFLDQNLIFLTDNQISINILANPVRNNIFKVVSFYPGVYLSFIKKLLNIGSNQLLLHISALEQMKLIESVELGSIKAFKTKLYSEKESLLGLLILKDTTRIILQSLSEPPMGKTINSLMKHTNLPRSTQIFWLENLKSLDIVSIQTSDSGQLYFLNEGSVNIIREILDKYKKLNSENIQDREFDSIITPINMDFIPVNHSKR